MLYRCQEFGIRRGDFVEVQVLEGVREHAEEVGALATELPPPQSKLAEQRRVHHGRDPRHLKRRLRGRKNLLEVQLLQVLHPCETRWEPLYVQSGLTEDGVVVVPQQAHNHVAYVLGEVRGSEVEEGEPLNGVPFVSRDEESTEDVRAAKGIPCVGHERGGREGVECSVICF